MKVPKARKLSSGTWFIQLRLGGQSIPITGADEKTCRRNAQAVKAEWLASKRLPEKAESEQQPAGPTLAEAIDKYIADKENVLSPATVRGYKKDRRNRFKDSMDRPISEIRDDEWQVIINNECKLVSPKTVKNAFALVGAAVKYSTKKGINKNELTLPTVPVKKMAFLQPEEIPIFVDAVKDLPTAVPLLLALSSLRASELAALRWEGIPKDPKFIRVQGAAVLNAENKLVKKEQNKNDTSTRNVPIMIPELAEAIKRDRQPSGPVLTISTKSLCRRVHKVCKTVGITDVNLHGLRHSYASLAAHLKIPEEITQEIGGWADFQTMRKIYTHVAKSDITRYNNALMDFYKKTAPSENAN